MPRELLREVMKRSERSAAPIKAAALLHIARVLTTFDLEQAVPVFDEGLSLARALPQVDGDIILGEALFLAAAIDPERAMGLLQEGLANVPHHFPLTNLILVMLDHGHVEKAIGYMIRPAKAGEYPFSVVGTVMEKCPDDETRLQIFRVALGSWIQRPVARPGLSVDPGFGFLELFSRRWALLPRDEATVLTREIVAAILGNPDNTIRARIGEVQSGVAFTSSQDHELFIILNVLHELIPDVLDSLLETHDQLAAGARRFPLGMESVIAQPRPPDAAPKGQTFAIASTGPADFATIRAKMQAELEGDFEPHFQEALRLYAVDSDPVTPNSSPRECWPSTQEFRNAMYRAGKTHGRKASSYLDRITDPDLRLFAEIEFIAALAALPQFSGSRRVFHMPGIR
jgi:hypothetical protein